MEEIEKYSQLIMNGDSDIYDKQCLSINDVRNALRSIFEATGEFKPSPGAIISELANVATNRRSRVDRLVEEYAVIIDKCQAEIDRPTAIQSMPLIFRVALLKSVIEDLKKI